VAGFMDYFNLIKLQCVALLEKNYTNPPEEILPISAFDLDEETRRVKSSKAQKRCNEVELYLKTLIVAQDKQCEILKEKCWNTMETKGRKLKVCIFHKQYIYLQVTNLQS
jgi:hypothetical protein